MNALNNALARAVSKDLVVFDNERYYPRHLFQLTAGDVEEKESDHA